MPDKDSKSANPPDDGSSHEVPAAIPDITALSSDSDFIRAVETGLQSALLKSGLGEQSANQAAGKTFLLALSGGPDSTALLAAMVILSSKLQFSMRTCHVNHNLRGAESLADEEFCRRLCARWSVPLDVRQMEPQTGAGPAAEATLRDGRYQLLVQSAASQQSDFIVTAHTLDDQIETMLFRLFRGTGPSGLTGMESARALDSSILLRPLLSEPGWWCLNYLSTIGLKARHDSSNDDVVYKRNYIRHQIVPAINYRFPGFQRRMEQLSDIVAQEQEFLEELSYTQLKALEVVKNRWPLDEFLGLAPALQRRLIVLALKQRQIAVGYHRVYSILQILRSFGAGQPGTGINLNRCWKIHLEPGLIKWLDHRVSLSGVAPLEQPLKVPGVNIIAAWGLALRIETCPPSQMSPSEFPAADSWEALVDLSQTRQPLVARTRAPGDTIKPLGMQQTVKLKRYLQTHKAKDSSGASRQNIIVVADQEEVIWVPGVGLSQKVKVTGKPTHRLSWVKISADEVNVC